MKKCDKILDTDLIKKNCENYYAEKNKAQGWNALGDGNKNTNKRWDGNKKDADPVSSQHKKCLAADIQLVDNILEVNCEEYDLSSTHSSCFHTDGRATSQDSVSPTPIFLLLRRLGWVVPTTHRLPPLILGLVPLPTHLPSLELSWRQDY